VRDAWRGGRRVGALPQCYHRPLECMSAAPSGLQSEARLMIRKVLTVAAVTGVMVAVAGCSGLELSKATPSPSGTPTPTEVLGVKAVSDMLTFVCTEEPSSQICAAIKKTSDGAWSVKAASRIVVIDTNISRNQFGTTFSQNACVLLASWVRDPQTDKPLDLVGVELFSSDIMMANCVLPKS
jgi:hypothetical protein